MESARCRAQYEATVEPAASFFRALDVLHDLRRHPGRDGRPCAGCPAVVKSRAMVHLHFWPIIQCLIVLTLANGAPVIAKKLLGGWLARPIDGGWVFWDGQPLLGRSKTLRGVMLAIVSSAIGGLLIGLEMETGVRIGLTAMAGDIMSSFLKRRLRLAPSAKAPGLDQVPESLLPFLAVKKSAGIVGLGHSSRRRRLLGRGTRDLQASLRPSHKGQALLGLAGETVECDLGQAVQPYRNDTRAGAD